MSKKTFTVIMEEELVRSIDAQAEIDDRSRNYMINKMVRLFLIRGALHLEKLNQKKGEME